MRRALALTLALWPGLAGADVVIVADAVRAGTILEAVHLTTMSGDHLDALTDMRDAIGMEARVNLYPQRPIRSADLGLPTLVERNARVRLTFVAGPLRISTEGRALARAGAGEPVRVMNMQSRATVIGVAVAPGEVEVTR